jgi:hypothetical protein
MNSFTDCKPFVMDQERLTAFKRTRRRFCCALCGHDFQVGDTARWIYANGTPGITTGNFFVCQSCDTGDDDCRKRGQESKTQAIKLARQWDIYWPDWQ